MNATDFIFAFKWWLILFLIGLSFLPLTSKIFEKFIDKGYIFSKIIGVLGITYFALVLGSLKLISFNFSNLILIWISIFLLQLFIFRKNLLSLKTYSKIFILEEIIFFIAILFWSFIRSFNPDIHDLEKFMDYGFINSILRSEYFPPKDMWLTPHTINYYYFGHLFTAVITKLTQIPSYISFNLMLATIFAFTLTSTFSIGINLMNRIKKTSLLKTTTVGLFFGLFISFSGNLQTIYAFFIKQTSSLPIPIWKLNLSIETFPNSYWYPDATRFIYNTIHEFPLYSFVVSDLHGHVLNIPVALLTIAILLVLFFQQKNNYLLTALLSFTAAISYMTNAWDGLIYLGLIIISIFTIELLNNQERLKNKLINSSIKFFKQIFILATLFFAFTFIFNMNFDPFASGIGLNCSPKILVEKGNLGPFLFEAGQCQRTPWWQFIILYGFFMYMVISFLLFMRNRKKEISDIFVIFISIFSFLLLIAPEIFYLKDIYTGHFRANTMFKLAYQAFMMLSISSAYIFIRIMFDTVDNSLLINKIKVLFRKLFKLNLQKRSNVLNRNIRSSFIRLIFFTITLILLFFVILYPYFAIPSGYGDLKIKKDLNGIKYLNQIKPEDYAAINWINLNIKGQPVILEAQGDSYTDFARISANTGLPTVLGWTVHEWLWRGSYDIPSARFNDIISLYETDDKEIAKKIINKYKIKYIYIGVLENEKYNIEENKFMKLGNKIFEKGNTKIYQINY